MKFIKTLLAHLWAWLTNPIVYADYDEGARILFVCRYNGDARIYIRKIGPHPNSGWFDRDGIRCKLKINKALKHIRLRNTPYIHRLAYLNRIYTLIHIVWREHFMVRNAPFVYSPSKHRKAFIHLEKRISERF